ncbi:MAG: hypothetical protein R6X18_06120 [Chloroflexota bacterium]
MRRYITFLVFTTLILFAVTGCQIIQTTPAVGASEAIDPAISAHILRSTVRIQIVAPLLDEHGRRHYLSENGQNSPLNAISRGLGTIVSSGEGNLIITTDHFDQLKAPIGEITITGSNDREIMLSLESFRSLIRYEDNFIIIFNAPPELPHGALPGDGDQVYPGSTVQIVHRHPDNGAISVIPALVDAWIDYHGIPSFQLQNLNGDLIVPGNSGGGVWHNGRPVGSIHRTILVDESGQTLKSTATPGSPSHLSYATRLSPVRMPMLHQGVPIAEITK